MPDGDTSGQPTETTPPPGDQIQVEVSVGRVGEWLGSLFGTDQEHAVGGGGTGGTFMFASVAELDSVISQWKDQREAIRLDGTKIEQASRSVLPPADDGMSTGMVDATMQSLDALLQHNQAMWKYANDYVDKLEKAREDMVNTDQSGQAAMNSLNQGLG